MSSTPASSWLSGKNLLGLVYVAIALGLIVNAAALTGHSVQWIRSASALDAKAQAVSFNLNGTIPEAVVNASLENPTGFTDLNLQDVTYEVFVNSTTQSYSFMGSSEVVDVDVVYGVTIPAGRVLNLTQQVRVTTDVVDSLKPFLTNHTIVHNDLRTFVGLTLYLSSSYISLNVPFCVELPGQAQTVCPSPRPQGAGGGGA